ncbi:MAG: hypothetical protein KC620_01955 [Myxococcales bacterium]|nr:hypothetical protein [Myxococcales bacterium]
MRAATICRVFLALSCFSISPAFALRYVKTNLPGLIDRAAFVFEGEVAAVDIGAGDKEPRTRVTVRVERVLAGDAPPSMLEFMLPMGLMADGTLLDIAEAPRFAAGERYLVFYKRGDWNISPVVNWDQGYYRLVQVGAQTYFTSSGGHCVTGVSTDGFSLGGQITQPVQPPGFGEVHDEGLHTAFSTASCLPADAVRAALARQLDAHPVANGAPFQQAPASNILFRRLRPEAATDVCTDLASCGPGDYR